MIRRKLGAILAALGLTIGVSASLGLAAPVARAQGFFEICQNRGSSSWCYNVKGGLHQLGQPVIAWSAGDPNNAFAFQDLSQMCNGGKVSATQACPFTPGGGLNTMFDGWYIVRIVDLNNTGLCAGTTSAGAAELTLCPNLQGNNGGNGTIDVVKPSMTNTAIVNRFWSYNSSCGDGTLPCGACAFSKGSAIEYSVILYPFPPSNYCLWNEII